MSQERPGTVTVRVPVRRAGQVRSPGRAVTDGSPHPVLVATRAVAFPVRPSPVLTLAVDAATARLVRRYHTAVVVVLVAAVAAVTAAAGFIAAVVVAGAGSFPAIVLALPVLTASGGLAVIAMIAALRSRPAVYPRADGPDNITVGGVRHDVAEEWRAANDPGVVTFQDLDSSSAG